MKIGSLVICLRDHNEIKHESGVVIKGIIPKKEDICTIRAIDEDGDLKLEESFFYYMGIECTFRAKWWRELEEFTPLSALLEEIDEHICVSL